MKRPGNSFEIMPELHRRMPRVGSRYLRGWRLLYLGKALLRKRRISRRWTALFGPEYRRSRTMIEIDITYLCNLHCANCNRSVTQAREALHMPLDTIRRFVDESIARRKNWRRIRILGGEPTLHPEFHAIVRELLRYKRFSPNTIVEVVTNGYGTFVERVLEQLPGEVLIDNTHKTSPVQPTFGPFNLAPIDDPDFSHADFANGCAVMEDCGMGLTPFGYYPCAVAGGIDRILRAGLGQPALPPDTDDMLEAARALCSLCGRFRDGHFVPKALRPPLVDEPVSPTWSRLYAEWHRDGNRKRLPIVQGRRS